MGSVKGWIRGSLIGAGAFGKVNLALNKENGQLFAVKSIECSDKSTIEMKAIENELQILQSLDSPFVVSCLGSDWSVENGKSMRNLFMEYMPGGSLADLMQKFNGKLEEELIRPYTRSILEGLNYLHARGVVHCDIKGKNVLVGTSGVKLADFGAAKRTELCSSADADPAMESMKGTPLWMAPEVARQVEQGPASDIWSLGCTIVEMATGKAPWSHLANPLVALYHIGCTEDLPHMPASLSADGHDFLRKCFQRDARVRWTATQLLAHPFIVGNFSAEQKALPLPASPTSILDLATVWESQTKSEMDNSVPILALKRAGAMGVRQDLFSGSTDSARASSSASEDWWCSSPLSPKEGNWITVRSPKVPGPSPPVNASLSDFTAPPAPTPLPMAGERVKLGLDFSSIVLITKPAPKETLCDEEESSASEQIAAVGVLQPVDVPVQEEAFRYDFSVEFSSTEKGLLCDSNSSSIDCSRIPDMLSDDSVLLVVSFPLIWGVSRRHTWPRNPARDDLSWLCRSSSNFGRRSFEERCNRRVRSSNHRIHSSSNRRVRSSSHRRIRSSRDDLGCFGLCFLVLSLIIITLLSGNTCQSLFLSILVFNIGSEAWCDVMRGLSSPAELFDLLQRFQHSSNLSSGRCRVGKCVRQSVARCRTKWKHCSMVRSYFRFPVPTLRL